MVTAISAWLLVASARIAVVFVAVLCAGWLLRRAGVEIRCTLWRSALILLVALSALPTASLVSGSPGWCSFPELSRARSYVGNDGVLGSPRSAQPFRVANANGAPPALTNRALSSSTQASDAKERSGIWIWSFVSMWLFGMCAHLSALVLGVLGLRARLRTSAPLESPRWREELERLCRASSARRAPAMRITDWRGAPALAGWLRPVVLLPTSCLEWSSARRRSVLAHELSHLIHRDPWFTLLAATLRSVFWFHPAVRWTVRQLARQQELRADRDVIAVGVDPIDYAESLVRLARRSPRPCAVMLAAPFARRSRLEERVRAVLDDRRCSALSRTGSLGALLLVLSSAAGALAVGDGPAGSPDRLVEPDPGSVSVSVTLPADLLELRLEVNGRVRVLPSQGERPALAVRADSAERARAFAERIVVEVVGDRVVCRGPRDRDPSLSIELRVPPELELEIHVHEGTLHCAATTASVLAHVSRGTLHFEPLQSSPGSVGLHVALGSLHARLPHVTGPFSATGGLADVFVTLRDPGSHGDALLSTGRGDVILDLPDSRGSVSVQCPNGSTSLPDDLVPDPGFRVQLLSGVGDVRVE